MCGDAVVVVVVVVDGDDDDVVVDGDHGPYDVAAGDPGFPRTCLLLLGLPLPLKPLLSPPENGN